MNKGTNRLTFIVPILMFLTTLTLFSLGVNVSSVSADDVPAWFVPGGTVTHSCVSDAEVIDYLSSYGASVDIDFMCILDNPTFEEYATYNEWQVHNSELTCGIINGECTDETFVGLDSNGQNLYLTGPFPYTVDQTVYETYGQLGGGNDTMWFWDDNPDGYITFPASLIYNSFFFKFLWIPMSVVFAALFVYLFKKIKQVAK